MASISLTQYEQAERELTQIEARRGVLVHAVITFLVAAALIAVNVLFVSEFPWSAFAVGGLLIGLGVHYYFGYLHVDENVEAHQRRIELRARGMR